MFPLYDTIPSRSFPFVNYLLIFLNIVVFLFQMQLNELELDWFFHHFGLVPARYTSEYFAMETGLSPDNYWPFFTNMFLHGGGAHLIGNMWTLYIFGDNVEDRMGHVRYLFFYLLCGVIASYTHFLINSHSTIPAVGASGAISGVMGAYMLLFPHSRIVFLLIIFFFIDFIQIPAFIYLLFWFAGQLFSGLVNLSIAALSPGESVGGIAFWAHIGGFVAGMLLYRIFLKKEKEYDDEYYELIE